MKKRLVSMLMAGAMMLSMFTGVTMSANAANTADTAFTFDNLNGSAYSEWRSKMDTSKVYVYPQTGPTITYIVEGRIRPVDAPLDRSKSATIPTGVKGSITNWSREYADTQTRLRFERYKNYDGITRGVWSQDSTRNYTVFN